MFNLIVDIGNYSAKLYLFKDERIVLHARKANDYDEMLRGWDDVFDIDKVIVSTVVDLPPERKEVIESIFKEVIWFDNTTPLPIEIKYGTPETLGRDRIAAAVGAMYEMPDKNLLVIDAGTAITLDFVDKNRTFCGGNIAPGVGMRFLSLHEYTSRLPLVKKDGETPLIGYDTETAIRSGIIRGVCHEIDGYINEIREKKGEVFVFLTGGDEKTLINNIKNRIFADKFLVAKGLNRILAYYGNK